MITINSQPAKVFDLSGIMMTMPPLSLTMDSFHDYEENIEWTNLVVKYDGFTVVCDEGYTGLWEMACFDKLSDEAKMELSKDLFGWMEDVINDEIMLRANGITD